MQDMTPVLTKRQRYWLEHIQACKESGKTIAEYAAEHGFGARAMYAGKKTLVKKGALPVTQAARFQRVRVIEAPVSNQWRAIQCHSMPFKMPFKTAITFSNKINPRKQDFY